MTNSLSVFTSMLLFFAIVLESFRWCFGTSSGTERPLLVKLPIEESVVKLLPSASSLRSSSCEHEQLAHCRRKGRGRYITLLTNTYVAKPLLLYHARSNLALFCFTTVTELHVQALQHNYWPSYPIP